MTPPHGGAPGAGAQGEPVDLACTRCRLSKGRTRVVPGEGPANARLVIVGEAPGAEEDRRGRPFVGRAGGLLDAALSEAGLSRDDVLVTNVVKCRPPDNRKPKRDEQEACRAFLDFEIAGSGAPAVVALGGTAAQALVGAPVKVSAAGGRAVEADVAGTTRAVFATLHPASARFRKGAREEIARALSAAADAAGLARRRKPPGQERLHGL